MIEISEKQNQPQTQIHHQTCKKQNSVESLQPKKQTLGKYQFSISQCIGGGMSGQVFIGINTQTAEIVCVKTIDRNRFTTEKQKLLLENQIRCQKACSSDSTIKILDVFDTKSFSFIVTEFCEGGDLYRLLKSIPEGIKEQYVSKMSKEIASSLQQLKKAEIIHRDIKSQNILLQKGKCKLGDFGFALQKQTLQKSKDVFNLGSPLYMSIEALEKSQYSFESDIFSYGVILYELIHKKSPWECNDQKQLLTKMKNQQIHFQEGVSQQYISLVKGCLSRNPEDRLTIEQILQHPFLLGA